MQRQTNVKLVTISIFIATFMTAIEGTIVSTAMPTIVGSLQGLELMNWVFSIYLLTNAMSTPIYGKLADKIGRKVVIITGIIIFLIGSSLCGLAQNMIVLIISRAIQGIGAGAVMPVALTILADMYPIEKRAKMLGLNNAAWGIASILGPLAGGFIVDTIGWHWIFFINVPVGILVVALLMYFLVEPKKEKEDIPMDLLGCVQLMLALFTLLIGFQLMGDRGIDWLVVCSLLLSALFFYLFVGVEKRAKDPLIDLKLFKNSTFVLINVIAALVSGLLMGVEVYIPMWMQGVLGKSAGLGGIVLAPMSVLWVGGSFLAGYLMKNISTKRTIFIGLTIIFVGSGLLALAPITRSYIWFFFISGILGVGLGLTITTTTLTVQNSVSNNKIGVATSFNTLVRTISQTLLISIFGVILNAMTSAELAKTSLDIDASMMNQLINPHTATTIEVTYLQPLKEILYSGLHNIYLISSGLVIMALVLTILMKDTKIKS